MKQATWYVIGLMSGTSLDGVDLVYVKFQNKGSLQYKIINASTIPYSIAWKKRLTEAFTSSNEELTKLDLIYSRFLGSLINNFILINSIKKIDFIASHGHTIFHKPDEGYTFQIGNNPIIAKTVNQTVVCDFRVQDVALGGQGAPLVPIGDLLLFSEYDFCLNIGGFANVSFDENGIRKAFDICPANIILNHYTRKIELEFDNQGKLARSGKINLDLLAALDALPTYLSNQSLGNEVVNSEFIPLINSFKLPTAAILRTFIEHFSKKIASQLKSNSKTLITGGGAYNNYLIERIAAHTKSQIIIPSNQLIDYKEALIFGLLGLLRIEKETNCLASVTKASKNHSSGRIIIP